MKNRFPTPQRASWRQRFVAIARQADAARRPALDPASTARSALRVRFAALTAH